MDERIEYLLSHPDELMRKKPFFRGGDTPGESMETDDGVDVCITDRVRVRPPRTRKNIVSQERFLRELDPNTHDVMFDENIPSICVKIKGGFKDIEFKRMGLPYQERIRQKQTLSLGGNPTVFTLYGDAPTEDEKRDYALIKEYWKERNIDGMRTKAIYTQKGVGDVGLLAYRNRRGEIRFRLLSYEDGYVIISHKDENGERLMECVYYTDEDGVERIDCYDDKNIYRMRRDETAESGWSMTTALHGFSEIPLATKRGDVAWNKVQSLIEVYEIIYNIFLVIQKRHGWGILYIRGRVKEQTKQVAGSVILQDTSIDGKGTAEFKTPPSPNGMIETLQSLEDEIQKGSSTTFLLPKDVKSSGDISALAIMLTQSLDLEGAARDVIEWQNFMDKIKRLFIEGLAKELVQNKKHETAITAFKKLHIGVTLKIWRPFNEYEYNQMLISMKSAGIISTKTAVEKNTVSTPDEEMRLASEVSTTTEQGNGSI